MTRKDGLWLWLSVALVVIWRAAAWSWPHPADSSPLPAQRMLGLLGLWFVGWGSWAWRRRPAPVTRLFAAYCLLSGLHWGGPVGAGAPQARALLLGVYLLLSVTAQCTGALELRGRLRLAAAILALRSPATPRAPPWMGRRSLARRLPAPRPGLGRAAPPGRPREPGEHLLRAGSLGPRLVTRASSGASGLRAGCALIQTIGGRRSSRAAASPAPSFLAGQGA